MAHINLTIPIITLMRIERDCQTGLKKKNLTSALYRRHSLDEKTQIA